MPSRRLRTASRRLFLLYAALVVAGTLGSASAASAQDIKQGPVLSVPIPDLRFTTIGGTVDSIEQSERLIGIPWIAEYVYAVYSYAVGIATLIAGVILIMGGFQYMTAGGDASRVSGAKQRIVDALIGLGLALGSYLILFTLSDELVSLRYVNIKSVPKEVVLFEQLGTGHPDVSDTAIDRTVNTPNNSAPNEPVTTTPPPGAPAPDGGSPPPSGGAPPPSGGAPPPPSAPPPTSSGGAGATGGETSPPEPPGGRVDVSAITYDRKLSPLENLNKYCTSRSVARAAGVTYEQKQQFLVKAVLGFIEVCVRQRGCAYAQGGWTGLPNGPAAADWLPNFSVRSLEAHGVTAEQIYASQPDCLDRWRQRNGYEPGGPKNPGKNAGGTLLLLAVAQCDPPADAAMRQHYLNPLNEAKLFAGDCGTTVRAILSCSGVDWQDMPTTLGGKPGGKRTGYPDARNLGKHEDNPRMIIHNYQKENLDALAAQKGGMRFGDMVYTCCGGSPGAYSAHWMMYIGGRPEVPFSFIEMGGNPGHPTSARAGGASIPGWGYAAGVVVKKPGVSLESFIRSKFIPPKLEDLPGWCRKDKWCRMGALKPAKGLENALVFVWRPFE